MSLRALYSDEANAEAEEMMKKKTTALNITGVNSKGVAKEVFNSIYELTRTEQKSKKVDKEDTEKLLKINPTNIDLALLTYLFADTANIVNGKKNKIVPSKYNTWDIIHIPSNYFYLTHPAMDITLGRFIFNKFVLQGSNVISITKIKNVLINKSALSKLDDDVSHMLLENKITRDQFNKYTDLRDTLGFWLNSMLAHTISEKMLKPLPEIEKRKAELIKKYEKEINAGNLDVMTKIADELTAYAKELLKDDPGMNLYLSGDLDFGNNYRNNNIIKGAVKNEITGEYDFVDTSFADGIKIKDIPAHANSVLSAQYPASIATAKSGYMGKQLLALLQMMQIDAEGTDCGTKHLIPVTVTKSNGSNLLYSYFIENGKERIFNEDDINKYMGKQIWMRSPMTCLNDKICSKCAGRLFYLLGIVNAGLFSTQLSHSSLNLALKSKHNSIVELYNFDPDNIIKDL